MNIYKLKKEFYLVYIFATFISVFGIFIINDFLTNTIFIMCIIASIVGFINSLCTSIELNEQYIVHKSLGRVTEIPIIDIESIVKMPTSKGKKIFIGVFTKGKKIYIKFWFNNYNELIAKLINKCERKSSTKIDDFVKKLIAK